jgi:hypothetical protein
MNDTSPAIEEELQRRFNAMTPEERLLRGVALIEAGWEIARYVVQQRFRPTTEAEARRYLAKWIYGIDLSEDSKPNKRR